MATVRELKNQSSIPSGKTPLGAMTGTICGWKGYQPRRIKDYKGTPNRNQASDTDGYLVNETGMNTDMAQPSPRVSGTTQPLRGDPPLNIQLVEGRAVCPICRTDFATERGVSQHLRKSHNMSREKEVKELQHFCPVPDCGFGSHSRMGLTMHTKSAHKQLYNDTVEQKAATRVAKVKRWQHDEMLVLIREEKRLVAEDPRNVRKINQLLHESHSELGTVEQIKAVRKTGKYHDLFEVVNPIESLPNIEGPQERAEQQQGEIQEETMSDAQGEQDNLAEEPNEYAEQTSQGEVQEEVVSEAQGEQDSMAEERAALHRRIAETVLKYKLHEACPIVCDPEQPSMLTNDMGKITRWIRIAFMATKKKLYGKRKTQVKFNWTSMSQRDKKRALRKLTQKRFEKNPGETVRSIMDDKLITEDQSDPTEVETFWKDFIGRNISDNQKLNDSPSRPTAIEDPYDMKEVKEALKSMNKKAAAGVDGVCYEDLQRAGPQGLLTLALIFQAHGRLPEYLNVSRVTFIPKVKNPRTPSDFRPISVCSALVRFVNSMLAKRLNLIDPDPRQVAYKKLEGTAINCYILQELVRMARQQPKTLCIAFLDVSKAFDSVNHKALDETLEHYGVPTTTREYLRNTYQEAKSLIGDESVHPTAGIGQGKPESGVIFNLVVARALATLEPSDGLLIDERWLTHLSFADDTVLISSSPGGLQRLMNKAVHSLSCMGLTLNAGKCASLILSVDTKVKKSYLNTRAEIKVNNVAVPRMNVDELYKYLGIRTGVEGLETANVYEQMKVYLERLTKAELKPQQRMWALRVCLYTKFIYVLTYTSATKAALNKLDRLTRQYVRKWLHLPHDVTNAAIHASAVDGGLGVGCYLTQIPRLQRSQIVRLSKTNDWLTKWAIETRFSLLKKRLEERPIVVRTQKRLYHIRQRTTREEEKEFWRKRLWESADGRDMEEHSHTTGIDRWVIDPSMKLTGTEYIKALHVRLKCLETPSRRSRFERQTDVRCGQCKWRADLNHISQICPLVHGMRVNRHDNICKRLQKGLTKVGCEVVREPRIPSGRTVLKPDILLSGPGGNHALDPIVTTKTKEMEDRYKRKQEKYDSIAIGDHWLIKEHEPWFGCTGIVLTYRGSMHSDSQLKLNRLLIRNATINYMIVGVLVDTWHMWRAWRDHIGSTSTR